MTKEERALKKRVAELEAREQEHARAEKVQDALYRIAEAASAAEDLPAFYATVHEIVATLMYADNAYIALYDDQRQAINYPYYVDSVDTDIPDPNVWEPMGIGHAAGVTAYALRVGRPLRIDAAAHHDLVARGEVVTLGVVGDGDWLGAPLVAEGRTLGVIVVQTYTNEQLHTEADEDLLAFVGQHIGSALSRARAIEETRQRNAELALVNEIGGALAKQLDFAAIIELVGERVRAIFQVESLFIALYDAATNLIQWPYDIDEGARFDRGIRELGPGITSTIIRSGRPLRISTLEEQEAAGAVQVGGTETQSWLGVPIHAGDQVIGVVGLESVRQHAFSEGDERLLSTLASSMGVALENARLFDETKRLLTETDQRNAELAVINDIGDALAEQLDYRAIIELVGERVRAIFDATTMDISTYDEASGRIDFWYSIEEGERYTSDPIEFGQGLTSQVIRSRAPLHLKTAAESDAHGAITVGLTTESYLGVPILAGDRVLGTISLQSLVSNAYDEADVRLLSTLASSMGVALENARLFEETKRLLTETDQRAAELAIINGVQKGLAAEIDMQAMYDLVGDKIQEIFDAQVVDIGVFDRETRRLQFPYTIERGVRFPDEPMS